MEDYFDYDENPIQHRCVYVSPDEEVYLIKKAGEGFVAENPFHETQEVTSEFAGLLRKTMLAGFLAKVIFQGWARVARVKDEEEQE